MGYLPKIRMLSGYSMRIYFPLSTLTYKESAGT